MDLLFSTAPVISAQSNPGSFETWQHWLFPSSCTGSGCWCLEHIKLMQYFILIKTNQNLARLPPPWEAQPVSARKFTGPKTSPLLLALPAGQMAHSNISAILKFAIFKFQSLKHKDIFSALTSHNFHQGTVLDK